MIRRLKNFKHFLLAAAALIYYRFPARRLRVVGVTGTDGKTTTVSLLYHLLTEAGFKTGMISTTGAKILDRKVEIGDHVTTPGSWRLQKLLREMVEAGVEVAVIEVTSIGLDQHRLLGCRFEVGVMTNLSREHLDYHQTLKKYLETKSKLFRSVKFAVLNRDDVSYKFLAGRLSGRPAVRLATYGIKNRADLTPKTFSLKTFFPQEFNQLNCLAAAGAARFIGVSDEAISRALASFELPSGRMEEVPTGRGFRVFVDFAHTPRAFEMVIPVLKKMTKGRVIHVFGCTGDRDKAKRPVMGEVAGRLADLVILTHEDTYREDPRAIIEMIEPGVAKSGKREGREYWKIADRKRAIEKALSLAREKDIVLITGVGHQKTLNLGGREVDWSDQKAVKKALKKASGELLRSC